MSAADPPLTAPHEGDVPLDTLPPTAIAGGAANPLSEREMDVARLLATGASNTEIARNLVISPHTVKVHLRNIFEKLQVNSRTEATMALVQRGWLEVAGAVRVEGTSDQATTPAPRAPAPLDDLPARPAPWQRIFLVVALLGTLAILVLPGLARPAQSSAPLLSDVGASQGSIAPITLDARWEALAPMPAPRSRHAVARVGSMIYAFGGEGERGEVLDSVVGFDLRVNRWRTASAMPAAVSNLAAATVNDAIYIAGGTFAPQAEEPTPAQRQASATAAQSSAGGQLDAQINPQLWRFVPAQNSWRVLGNLPVAVAGASLLPARFNGQDALVLVGGWDGATMRDEVWLLPLDAAITSGSSDSAGSASGDSNSAGSESGGSDSVNRGTGASGAENAALPVGTEEAIDTPDTDAPDTDTPSMSAADTGALSADPLNPAFTSPLLSQDTGVRWQLLTRLPQPRAFLGAAMVGDDLYVVGGFDGKAELADADRYNLASGRWEQLPALQNARSGLALVYDDVALHALGGGWLANVDSNERFDLATESWATVPSPVAGSWRHLGAASADGALYLLGGWNGDYMDLAIAYQSTFRSLLPVITNP